MLHTKLKKKEIISVTDSCIKLCTINHAFFMLTGTVQPDDCVCPKPLHQWLKQYGCPAKYSQIDKDLQLFQAVNFSSFHSVVTKKVEHSGSMSVCNYIIKQNNVRTTGRSMQYCVK